MVMNPRTAYLNLPLPHEKNDLREDLPRLIAQANGFDAHAKTTDTALAARLAQAVAADEAIAGLVLRAAANDAQATRLEGSLEELADRLAGEEAARQAATQAPTPERRGAIRVGSGLHLENQDMLAADVATSYKAGIIQPDNITTQVNADGVLSALGGNLLYNEEVWITASGPWVAPVTGWYDLWIIGGGGGAFYARDGDIRKVNSGSSGGYLFTLKHFNAGDTVAVTIGAAGQAYNAYKNGNAGSSISYPTITTFGDLASNSAGAFAFVYNPGVGVPNQNGTAYVNVHGVGFGSGAYNGPASFYGGSGGALVYQYNPSHTEVVQLQNGKQGAVRLRFWNPAKAAGPTA